MKNQHQEDPKATILTITKGEENEIKPPKKRQKPPEEEMKSKRNPVERREKSVLSEARLTVQQVNLQHIPVKVPVKAKLLVARNPQRIEDFLKNRRERENIQT